MEDVSSLDLHSNSPSKLPLRLGIIGALIVLAFLGYVFWTWFQDLNRDLGVAPSLTSEERAQIIADLNERSKNIPALSSKEREKIISELNTASKETPTLSPEERAKIINELSKQSEQNI